VGQACTIPRQACIFAAAFKEKPSQTGNGLKIVCICCDVKIAGLAQR
jgi:hypothetical protein